MSEENKNKLDTKLKEQRMHHNLLMRACFGAFLIGNLTNIMSFVRVSPSGTGLRYFINYILWPLLGLFFGGGLLKKSDYNEISIKSVFWNKAIIGFILILSMFLFFLNMRYEEEKNLCMNKEEKNNIVNCLKEADMNRFNFKKLF